VAVLALQPPLGALRWHIILKRLGIALPWSGVLRWTYTGVFVNQVLPATVGGDGVRIWLASRSGNALGPIVNSVVLDRLAMVLSLVVLVIASAPWYGALVPPRQLQWLSLLLALGTVCGLLFMLLADALPAAWQRHKVVAWVASLSRDTRRLFLGPAAGPGILGLSLLSVVNLMVSLCLFAQAFGAQADAWDLLMVLPPVILASTLPISLGGWGTREIAMVAAMGTVGVQAEAAILASVMLGVASIVTALPGAFFHFMRNPPMPIAPTAPTTTHTAEAP